MSVIGILQQLSFGDNANHKAFIDLPGLTDVTFCACNQPNHSTIAS
jgi:hypothetical protein